MGITDKISGRVKQAAGDLTGSDALSREGRQEERKADAQAELAREELRADRERAEAEQAREDAEQRAAETARRAFDRADTVAGREEAKAAAADARADERAAEVDRLEHSTDPDAIAESSTKDELYEEARALDVEGRSEMTKDELAEAIRQER